MSNIYIYSVCDCRYAHTLYARACVRARAHTHMHTHLHAFLHTCTQNKSSIRLICAHPSISSICTNLVLFFFLGGGADEEMREYEKSNYELPDKVKMDWTTRCLESYHTHTHTCV